VKCGVRVALGVAGGYLLGRTKKMKLALMIGGMAAGKKAGGPGQLLAQGTKLLGQSPELTRLTDEIRGRLLDAGKAAAVAVATRQVEALTERVVGRVGSLTDVGGKTVTDVGDTVGDVGRSVGDVGRRVGGRSRPDDDAHDDETVSADAAGDEDEAIDEEAAVDDDTAVDEDTVIDDDAAVDEDTVIDDDAAVDDAAVDDAAVDDAAVDDAAADEERTDEDTLDDEDAVDDEEPTDEDTVDEEEDAAPVEAPPPVRRRASKTAANARRAGDPAGTRAAAAGSAAVRATGRRSGRSARARQGGSDA